MKMFYIFTKQFVNFLNFCKILLLKNFGDFYINFQKFLKVSALRKFLLNVPLSIRNSGDATGVHCMIVQYNTEYNELNSCIKFCLMSPRPSPEQKSWCCSWLSHIVIFRNYILNVCPTRFLSMAHSVVLVHRTYCRMSLSSVIMVVSLPMKVKRLV